MPAAFTLSVRDRLPSPRWSEAIRLLSKAIAVDELQLTKSHLYALDEARPNRLGGSRSHYYGVAARGTTVNQTAGDITISIKQIGMNLHYYGGTVVPKVRRWLAIPARTEAYGRRPIEFENLKFVKVRDDLAYLKIGTGGTRAFGRSGVKNVKGTDARQEGVVLYWLVKRAVHRADTSVIPTESAYRAQADITVNRVINALRSGRRTVGGLGGTP